MLLDPNALQMMQKITILSWFCFHAMTTRQLRSLTLQGWNLKQNETSRLPQASLSIRKPKQTEKSGCCTNRIVVVEQLQYRCMVVAAAAIHDSVMLYSTPPNKESAINSSPIGDQLYRSSLLTCLCIPSFFFLIFCSSDFWHASLNSNSLRCMHFQWSLAPNLNLFSFICFVTFSEWIY